MEDHFAGKGYAQLKGDLAEATIEFLKPFQERVRGISDEELDEILERGREKASQIARATLKQVFERTGLTGSLKR
jgi:tryptophanyl-tRNA synthetase